MTEDEILAEFRAADALLEGHFILSSGLHSPRYLQCARVLMDPARAARLASALAHSLPLEVKAQISIVVSPAMGGVIIGHEMGLSLGLEAVFLERPAGTFELRRGFRIEAGQKALLVEDVVTTGLSSREAIAAVDHARGGASGGWRRPGGRWSPLPLWSTARTASPISACPSSRSSASTCRSTS